MTLPHPTENGGRERMSKTLARSPCLDPKRTRMSRPTSAAGTKAGLNKLVVWLFEKCNKSNEF